MTKYFKDITIILAQWYLLSHDNRIFSVCYKMNTVTHLCILIVYVFSDTKPLYHYCAKYK